MLDRFTIRSGIILQIFQNIWPECMPNRVFRDMSNK